MMLAMTDTSNNQLNSHTATGVLCVGDISQESVKIQQKHPFKPEENQPNCYQQLQNGPTRRLYSDM